MVCDQLLREGRQCLSREVDVDSRATQRVQEPIEVRIELVKSLAKGADLFGDRGAQDHAGVVDLQMGLGGR